MYKLKLHRNLTPEKWSKFSRSQQILMIANEINRAKNWLNKGDKKEALNAYERALELIDLTISVTKKYNLLKELLRFREILALQYTHTRVDSEFNDKLLRLLISLDSTAFKTIYKD